MTTQTKKKPTSEVRRALAAHRRALTRLIDLLKSPDPAVRMEAATAPGEWDPPRVWPMFEAIGDCRDRAFRVLAVQVLEQMAEWAPAEVGFGLTSLLRAELDPEVRAAVHRAALSMGSTFSAALCLAPDRR